MKQKVGQINIRKYLWFSLLLLCLVFFSILFSDILAILIISLLIAMILNPVVDFFEKQGFNRLVSVLLVFIICSSLLLLVFSYLLPKVLSQLNTLAMIITPESLLSVFSSIEIFVKKLFPFLNTQNIINRISLEFQNLLFGWINNVSSILYSLFSVLALLVIVPFITFFLLKDSKKIIKGIINIMPNRYFEFSYWVIKKISIQLGRFVRGWILDAAIVGTMAGIGLAILGINNAASIGFVAGVGHLIPYFGPVIGGIPAIIISIIQLGNFSMLPKIVLLFALVYIIDNGYIQPRVFSKSTDMHPLLIIILILIGGKLLGVIGMLLAVPAATVIKTAAKEIYYGYKNYKIIRT